MGNQPAKTVVVNIRHNPKEFDVYIGRPGLGFTGPYGNPWRFPRDGSRQEVVERFEQWFIRKINRDEFYRKQILGLRGKRLGCFCAAPCHGQVLADFLNASA